MKRILWKHDGVEEWAVFWCDLFLCYPEDFQVGLDGLFECSPAIDTETLKSLIVELHELCD